MSNNTPPEAYAGEEFLQQVGDLNKLGSIRYDSTGDAATSFIGRAYGVYTFKLTVTDPFGASDTDTVQIEIYNVAPVAYPGRNRSITVNETESRVIVLDGGASIDANSYYDFDPDDPENSPFHTDIVSHEWAFASGPEGVADVTLDPDYQHPARVSFDTLELDDGIYTFGLTVTDTLALTDEA